METGVYKIYFKNKIDRIYIGSTSFIRNNSIKTGFYQRKYNHLNSLRLNKHFNKYLQRCFNKYGEENFIFEIIERCKPEKCIEREQYWLDFYQSYKNNKGYNLLPTAGSNKGYIRTKEHNKNLSKSIKKYFENNEIYNKKITNSLIENVKEKIDLKIHYSLICKEFNIKKSTYYNIKAKLSTGLK